MGLRVAVDGEGAERVWAEIEISVKLGWSRHWCRLLCLGESWAGKTLTDG